MTRCPLLRPHPGGVREWTPEEFGAPPRAATPPAPSAAPPDPPPAANELPHEAPPDPAARAAGFQAGHGEGYTAGHQEGYATGYAAGHQAGYDEGHAAGYADGHPAGYAAGTQDGETYLAALRALLDALTPTVTGLQQTLADEVLALSVAIARKMVGHALQTQPAQILEVIQTALSTLPPTRARIHLHPQDLALVRAHLAEHPALMDGHLVEDPQISRGGCTLTTDTTQIDATVATRWARLLSAFPADLQSAAPTAAATP